MSRLKYDLVCGLETHIELSTERKMFCPCKVKFGNDPNTNCCPICTGAPGTLPVLNHDVVSYAIRMGLALNCSINLQSKMERKCYFYPDLAKSYQTSQNDNPLCGPGYVQLSSGKKIRINHIHIEEDAGKIKNESDGLYLDDNRAGVPLIEIVSEPDISSVDEAREYIERLQMTARYVRVSDARMQEGSIRCDVNISVRPEGTSEFGTRIEIKNMNSISFICKALQYEYNRQVDALECGEKLIQETRRFNESKGCTESMRTKENASDYGYFPEPDLATICLTQEYVDSIKNNLPELFDKKLKRYISLGIPEKSADLLVKYVSVAEFFDSCLDGCLDPLSAANLIIGPIFSYLGTEAKKEEFDIKVSSENLRDLVNLISKNKLNQAQAKKILLSSLESNEKFSDILDEFLKNAESFDINEICKQCVLENQDAVNDYLSGKEKALQSIIGKVMAKTKGQANASQARSIVISLISNQN